MASEQARRRPYRARKPQAPPRADAITTALSAQVALCILLILTVCLVRKFDAPTHLQIREQYQAMASDRDSMSRTIAWFTQADGLWASLEQFFTNLFSGRVDVPPESVAEDAGGSEPESPASTAESTPKLSFDYLGDKALEELGGSGGLNPVDAKDGAGSLQAPSGSVLSPVYLTVPAKPPVTGLITSGFSFRYHPVSGESDFHTGIDIAAEEGRPILAALPGEVAEVGESDTYGNYIMLKHATNLMTFYAHCSEIIAREGMSVRQGERIAKVGQTGVATGPHLHFSVIVEGEYTDPEWILKDYIRLVE